MKRLATILRTLAGWLSPCEVHAPTWHTRPIYCGICWIELDSNGQPVR